MVLTYYINCRWSVHATNVYPVVIVPLKGMMALKVQAVPFDTRHVANSSVAQTNEGSGTATAGNAAQTTTIVEAPPIEAPKKRGRKAGSRTKFKLPARGFKVALKPSGDE